MWHRLLFACALLAIAFHAPRARADTTCTAIAQNIVFSGYDGSTQATASGNITVNCSTFTGANSSNSSRQTLVTMCVYLGNSPRRLSSGTTTLTYDLLTPPPYNTTWGNTAPAPSSQMFQLQYLFPNGIPPASGSITIPVNAVLPAQAVSSGTYSQSYVGQQATLVYAANESNNGGNPGFPTSCTSGYNGQGTLPLSFNVSAAVIANCQVSVSATNLDFGNADFITAPVDGTAQITLNCANSVSWNIGLDNGSNYLFGTPQRKMTDGSGNYVNYELYRDAGRSLRWGNTVGTDTLSGSGSTSSPVTVYGRVPAPQNAVPGSYTDTVNVNVYY